LDSMVDHYKFVLEKRQTHSTIVSFSKGNSFTSVPFTGTGKLKIIFLIQLPSGCLSGNNAKRERSGQKRPDRREGENTRQKRFV